jgi:acyl carrier protein
MQHREIFEKMVEILRDVLDDPDLELEEFTVFKDIQGWDSLAFVTLFATLESECEVRLDMVRLQSLQTVGEAIGLVENSQQPQ